MNDSTIFVGGGKLASYLDRIADRLGGATEVRVGFLEGATYPDGKPVAMIAAIQEWGARIEREPGEATIFRKVNAKGTAFLRNGRFVRKSASNFASTHYRGAYVITIPSRPFFRTMVKEKSPAWGDELGKVLKAHDYDAATSLGLMGQQIKGQLQQSIVDWSTPPNAKSTIRAKGFNDPLVHTGFMLRSVDYETN